MESIKTILDRIRKPLSFAGRDDFSHLKALAALEPFIRVQIEELKRLSNDKILIEGIEKLFTDFDKLPPQQKRDRILDATTLLDAQEFRQDPHHASFIRQTQHGPPPQGEKIRIILPPSPSVVQEGGEKDSIRLDTLIQYCKGIGPKRAEMLKKLGISSV